jgi:hypothetical protein
MPRRLRIGHIPRKTLTAGAGAYATAGQVADLRPGQTRTADGSTYSIVGRPAGLRVARRVAAASTTFSVTGFDAAGIVGTAPVRVGVVTSFTLTRSTTGSTPFWVGVAFRKGDVLASDNLTLTGAATAGQVTKIAFWDDGSVKLAAVAGLATIAIANAPQTVNVTLGTPASGSALSEAQLIAAAQANPTTGPVASVSYGSYGTVTLSATSLMGTSAMKIAEHTGPQYAQFQYVAPFPNNAGVRAVFYVQFWASGHYRIRVAVENGTAPQAYVATSGTATITIGGTQMFSSPVSMPGANRFDAVRASFAEATPAHDVQYLRATKLVPNYGYTTPSSNALNALNVVYSPMNGMSWPTDMGATAAQPYIGLIAHWDALYCTSSDSRAYQSVINHNRAFGVYSVFWRDQTTYRMPRFSDYPMHYHDGDHDMVVTGSTHRWEVAHSPNAGYLAWLLTCERFHLEVLQANAWASWATQFDNNNLGVTRTYDGQTRGRAWISRSIAACAAVSPQGDGVAADCRTSYGSNMSQAKATYVDPNFPATGLLWIYDDKDGGIAADGFNHSIFESLFVTSSLSWGWDIEPGLTSTQKSDHLAVRNFAQRVPVGLCGRGAAFGEYNVLRAPGKYRMTIGSSNTLSSLYNTWLQVENATWGDGLAWNQGDPILGNPPTSGYLTTGFADGNWAHVLGALSFAVDHGATGAQAAYDRLTSASNWATNAAYLHDTPEYAVVPRVPAWYGLQTTNTWKNLGASWLSGIGPSLPGTTLANGQTQVEPNVGVFSYSGGALNNKSFYDRTGLRLYGAAMFVWGGGHQAYGGNEMDGFRLYDQTWYRSRAAYPTPLKSTNENPDGTPVSRHTYSAFCWIASKNWFFSPVTGARYADAGEGSHYSHRFDCTYSAPNSTGPGPWTRNPDLPDLGMSGGGIYFFGMLACYDSDNDRVVCFQPGPHRAVYYNPNNTAAPWTVRGIDPGTYSYTDRGSIVHIPGKNWCVFHLPPTGSDKSGLLVVDMNSDNPVNVIQMVTSGSPPSASTAQGLAWDSRNGRVVACDKNGNLRAAQPPATVGGTWNWIALTNTGGDTPDSQAWSGEGVWGRFGYVNDGALHGYVLVAGPNTRPCFYKLG